MAALVSIGKKDALPSQNSLDDATAKKINELAQRVNAAQMFAKSYSKKKVPKHHFIEAYLMELSDVTSSFN